MSSSGLICDRCNHENALSIEIGFLKNGPIQKYDICSPCMLRLVVILLEKQPEKDKMLLFNRFMEGVIV